MITANGATVPDYSGAISPEFRSKALTAFERYKGDKSELKQNIIDNYTWYKKQRGLITDPKKNEPKPTTGYIFNAIENKYADAIDNYPEASVIEREAGDTEVASKLSVILPVLLEYADFKKSYKDAWRRKLKSGTGIYFIDYNREIEEITINSINVLAFFADFNIADIQDSEFIFVTSCEENSVLKELYPVYAEIFSGDASLETAYGTKKLTDRTEIVDCYYKKVKKNDDGSINVQVHMMKLAGECIIDATEDMKEYENGMYDHGKYPFVLDTLYPNEDCPFGFGVIDVIKNPQEFIDKIDACVARNTLIASKKKYFIKRSAGINPDDVADGAKDIVEFDSGNLDEIIKDFQPSALPAQVVNYRDRKIEELKEIIGNRDFQQGGNAGGVTSGSAIELLQRSGEKMSRASIDDSYDAYRRVCIMVIELIRQFYTRERTFRITGDNGEKSFVSISSTDFETGLQLGGAMQMPQEMRDALGFPQDKRSIQFDISVTAQRSNPYTKQGHNATMIELWKLGVFNSDNIENGIMLIQNMQFEGKEKIIQSMQERMTQLKQEQMAIEQQQMIQAPIQEEMVNIPIGG